MNYCALFMGIICIIIIDNDPIGHYNYYCKANQKTNYIYNGGKKTMSKKPQARINSMAAIRKACANCDNYTDYNAGQDPAALNMNTAVPVIAPNAPRTAAAAFS